MAMATFTSPRILYLKQFPDLFPGQQRAGIAAVVARQPELEALGASGEA
jgi:hypothetical protein